MNYFEREFGNNFGNQFKGYVNQPFRQTTSGEKLDAKSIAKKVWATDPTSAAFLRNFKERDYTRVEQDPDLQYALEKDNTEQIDPRRNVYGNLTAEQLGPWGMSIGETPEQIDAFEKKKADADAAAATANNPVEPVNDVTSNLTDIYNKSAGLGSGGQPSSDMYSLGTGLLVGADQVTPDTNLPAQEPVAAAAQASQMAGPYGMAMNALNENPNGYGSLMKSMRGNRIGALMSQYGMPRRGGNIWGMAGQGTAQGGMGYFGQGQNSMMMGNTYAPSSGTQKMMGPWGAAGSTTGGYGASPYSMTPYSGGTIGGQ